jgi:uncharacterized protein YajQ (UPF0234 family)
MPSFDVVSEIDMHEVSNAVDQANREVGTRFDFKGTGACFELRDASVHLESQAEFQLQQMMDILRGRLAKRGVDLACLDEAPPVVSGNRAVQDVALKQGIDAPLAKQMIKRVKDSKLKVQCSIQGNQLRVTGKKRDDLQAVIALLREAEIDLPLQFKNFRD